MMETALHKETNPMTNPSAVDIAALVDRYVAIWNQPNAQTRGHLVGTLWSDEGIEFTDKNEYQGHLAIESRVAAAYDTSS
jgi:uncharacterized protein